MEHSLSELEGAVWELYRWVLAEKAVMEGTECFVLLVDGPGLAVKLDFNDVFCVSAMVNFVLDHPCSRDLHLEGNLKEDGALSCTIFGALLHMVNEDLSREEDVAEFALHRDRMLKDPLIDLH